MIRHTLRRVVVLGALGFIAAATPAAAQESLRADQSCHWAEADCNAPVRGLVEQFRQLHHHGDLIGFRMGAAPDVSLFNHWQGVQRLSTGSGQYLAVSRSGKKTSFVIVRMGSRDASGERYRSNKLEPARGRRPPATDSVVKVVRSDAGFDHSGGMQSSGDILAVGLEHKPASRVAFWNVANPRFPHRVGTLDRDNVGAGTVSLAKLHSGRHLLIVGRKNANKLDFYLSPPGRTLASPRFERTTRWDEDDLVGGDSEFGNYQNLNLVASTDGRLYLIGTHRDRALTSGADFADLFLLSGNTRSPRIRKVASRQLICRAPGGSQCNFDAGGGTYVTPSGGLLLYGTEYDNDGPGGSVKAEEFRPAPHRLSCADINDAWVELYDDTGFGDRSIMIDYRDRALRNYANYDRVEDFEDKASAAKWCLPVGWRYFLYEHKSGCRGRIVQLVGSGRPANDRRFGDGSGVVRRFNDAISCSFWIAPPPPPPPPPGTPDLIVSDFQLNEFTVRNQGDTAAGPFSVSISSVGSFTFGGLAAGATATRPYSPICGGTTIATADSLGQVTESNEMNNNATASFIC